MDYITTTDLRTKSSQLVDSLKKGKSVELIHRSRVIGKIEPAKAEPKLFDAKEFIRLRKKLGLFEDLSDREREARYRKHLEAKYGKNLS